MDQAFRWVALLSQGLQSNFWGLGCPPHCQAFPLSSFLLAFLIGWLLGLLSLASFLGLLPVSGAHLPQASQSGHSPLSRHGFSSICMSVVSRTRRSLICPCSSPPSGCQSVAPVLWLLRPFAVCLSGSVEFEGATRPLQTPATISPWSLLPGLLQVPAHRGRLPPGHRLRHHFRRSLLAFCSLAVVFLAVSSPVKRGFDELGVQAVGQEQFYPVEWQLLPHQFSSTCDLRGPPDPSLGCTCLLLIFRVVLWSRWPWVP